MIKLSFGLVLLSLALSTYSQSSTENPAQFMDTIIRKDYSISTPDGWTVDSSESMGADLFLFSPRSEDDDSSENMNVFIQPLTGQAYDLEGMGKESEAQILQIITNVEIFESHVVQASPYPYYSLKYHGQHGAYQLTTEQRYFLHNEIGYALTFTFKKGEEDPFRKVVNEIFESFRFL